MILPSHFTEALIFKMRPQINVKKALLFEQKKKSNAYQFLEIKIFQKFLELCPELKISEGPIFSLFSSFWRRKERDNKVGEMNGIFLKL